MKKRNPEACHEPQRKAAHIYAALVLMMTVGSHNRICGG